MRRATNRHYGDHARHKRRVRPGLLVLGGRLLLLVYMAVEFSGKPLYIRRCFDILGGIVAANGTYCVLGNHDHWVDAELSRSATASGFRLIDNGGFWLVRGQDRIRLGGVGDLLEDTQDATRALGEATQDDYTIIVSHNPDYFAQRDPRIDLMLSGHTHGGQLVGLWAPVLPVRHREYAYGLVQEGDAVLYVTSGIGTITPPLRFFRRPEIVLITLTH